MPAIYFSKACVLLLKMEVPDDIPRHHRGRHCGCRGRRLLLLNAQSVLHFMVKCLRTRIYTHRLKLVTGVDISTRPVSRSGRLGKEKRRRRMRVAETKTMAFRRSSGMIIVLKAQSFTCRGWLRGWKLVRLRIENSRYLTVDHDWSLILVYLVSISNFV